MTDTANLDDAEDLLSDFEREDSWSKRHNLTTRTTARYRKEGLPWASFGGHVYIHKPGGRGWMLKRIRVQNQRRVAPQRKRREPKATADAGVNPSS